MMCSLFTFFIYWAHADVQFPTKNLIFDNGVSVKVEMAQTSEQKTQGLMNRTKLAENEGMLFVFTPPQYLSFWMKNTRLPLDIGFFNEKRELLQVLVMEPVLGPVDDHQLPRYESAQTAMYALEVQRGWFAKKKIKVKTKFRFQ